MTLSEAITAVETSQQTYNSTVTTTTADQLIVTNIQTKLDAANIQVTTDITEQKTAADAFNASLDALIAAATASKITP